jgi:tetratricopeptide (TPR) repeat protein
LLDYWPLRRLSGESSTAFGRLILEKTPLLALSFGVGLMNYFREGCALVSWTALPLTFRVENALVAYIAYLGKMVWPQGLIVLYPHSMQALPLPSVLAAAGLLLIFTILAFALRRQFPYVLIGWLWYLGTLVPVIGLLQVGPQSLADRSTYVPLIGVFILLVWGIGDVAARWQLRRELVGVLGTGLVAACMMATMMQVRHWRTTEAVWRHVLQVDPNHLIGNEMLARVLHQQGNEKEAALHIETLTRLQPDRADHHNDLGIDLWKVGQVEAALDHFAAAVRIQPRFVRAYYNLGLAYEKLGRLTEARDCYRRLIELRPQDAKYQRELAYVLYEQGQRHAARTHYQQSLELDPAWLPAAQEAAWYLATRAAPKERDEAEAIKLAKQVCQAREKPSVDGLELLAAVYAAGGRFPEAVTTAEQALAVAGDESTRTAQLREQLQHYRKGQLAPRSAAN